MSKISEKLKAVAAAIGAIEKQFGKGAVMRLGEGVEPQKVETIPSGSLGLDIALGCGGYPRGRVVEIYGPESAGKTTLTLHAIAQVQAQGRGAVLLPMPAASAAATLLVVLLVPAERAGRRELAELVPDHRLRHEHRDVLAPVVHRDGVTEHGGHDHRATRPGADDLLAVARVLRDDLLQQVVVHEGALLETPRHASLLLLALLADRATADDELVALLVGVPGAALGLAPRADRVASTGGLALTTTVRVVDRVHGHAADGRADALPAVAAGLAPVDVRLLGVADLADGGAAARVGVADLAGRQAQLRVRAVLRHEAHTGAGRAGHLRAAAGAELDRVHDGADRDVLQRQVVAGLDVGRRAGLHDVALPEP